MRPSGSAWHRRWLAGIDLVALTEDIVPTLPTMTKNDLMVGFDDIVTDPALRLPAVEEHLLGCAATRTCI